MNAINNFGERRYSVIQERWQEIKEKLVAALDLEPAGRRAYLDRVAGADSELRRELESLLAAHEKAGSEFSEHPCSAGNLGTASPRPF